jgi:hypothetical protein
MLSADNRRDVLLIMCVCYEQATLAIDCLRDAIMSGVDTVVISNGMHHDDENTIERMGAKIVRTNGNILTGDACNLGLNIALQNRYRYVVKADPDTIFLDTKWATTAIAEMDFNTEAGIGGDVWPCPDAEGKVRSLAAECFYPYRNPPSFDHVQGGFQFMRCKALEMCGLYRAWSNRSFEDVELSWRMAHFGWKLLDFKWCRCNDSSEPINGWCHVSENITPVNSKSLPSRTMIAHPVKIMSVRQKIRGVVVSPALKIELPFGDALCLREVMETEGLTACATLTGGAIDVLTGVVESPSEKEEPALLTQLLGYERYQLAHDPLSAWLHVIYMNPKFFPESRRCPLPLPMKAVEVPAKYITAEPWAHWASRRPDEAMFWEAVSKVSAKSGLPVVAVGGRTMDASGLVRPIDNRGDCKVIDMVGIELKQTTWVVGHAALHIGADSGLMRIATYFGIPCATILMSTTPEWTRMDLPRNRFVLANVPCAGCSNKGLVAFKDGQPRCPYGVKCSKLWDIDSFTCAALNAIAGK